MNNVNKILAAASGHEDRLRMTPPPSGYHANEVLKLEFNVSIGRSARKPGKLGSRTAVVGFTQYELDSIAEDVTAGRIARVPLRRNPELAVIARFRTGNKNHKAYPSGWLDASDGSIWLSPYEVIHNVNVSVVGWADELAAAGAKHDSGWTGALPSSRAMSSSNDEHTPVAIDAFVDGDPNFIEVKHTEQDTPRPFDFPHDDDVL